MYVYGGSGELGGKPAKMGDWVALKNDGDSFTMTCSEGEEMRVLLLAGKPIGEPVCSEWLKTLGRMFCDVHRFVL